MSSKSYKVDLSSLRTKRTIEAHFSIASFLSDPRGFLSALSKKENLSPTEQTIIRAEAAQQNGFENLSFFAVSVVSPPRLPVETSSRPELTLLFGRLASQQLAGNYAKIPASTLNTIAAGYLASRFVLRSPLSRDASRSFFPSRL